MNRYLLSNFCAGLALVIIVATAAHSWTEADINQDGAVDGMDLFIVATNYGRSQRTVTLTWKPNTDVIDGYKIYMRRSDDIDYLATPVCVTAEARCQVHDLDDEVTYYFVATAYRDTDGLESDHSNEAASPATYVRN